MFWTCMFIYEVCNITVAQIKKIYFHCVTGYGFVQVTSSIISLAKNNNGGDFWPLSYVIYLNWDLTPTTNSFSQNQSGKGFN